MRGKAQREWDLMSESSKASFITAVQTLQTRLECGSRAVAAQDFRDLSQRPSEMVSDFICRLEKTFRQAYGNEQMSEETRNTLLYGQLNEGLKYNLIKSPAVSGASGYQQLCIAARNEERHQNDLIKRQQYQQGDQRTNRTEKSPRQYGSKVLLLRSTRLNVGIVRKWVIKLKIVDKERNLMVQSRRALANHQVKQSLV